MPAHRMGIRHRRIIACLEKKSRREPLNGGGGCRPLLCSTKPTIARSGRETRLLRCGRCHRRRDRPRSQKSAQPLSDNPGEALGTAVGKTSETALWPVAARRTRWTLPSVKCHSMRHDTFASHESFDGSAQHSTTLASPLSTSNCVFSPSSRQKRISNWC